MVFVAAVFMCLFHPDANRGDHAANINQHPGRSLALTQINRSATWVNDQAKGVLISVNVRAETKHHNKRYRGGVLLCAGLFVR